MELNAKNILFLVTTIVTGLSAGLFYGWVVSVIPGTKKLTDQAYLETMQSINKEILNPAFVMVFFGALFLLITSTIFQYRIAVNNVFYLALTATLVYAIGTIGFTMFGNVPLNNVFDALDPFSFTTEDYKNARLGYEAKWNALNLVRTIAAVFSFVLILIALVRK